MSSTPPVVDPALRARATPAERKYIDAVNKHGTQAAAARALGVNKRTVERALASALRRARDAAIEGLGHRPGFETRELSTSYDADGGVLGYSMREAPAALFESGGVGEGDARDGLGDFVIKGVSTNFGADGSQRQQWVKTKLSDQARVESLRAAIEAAAETLPRVPPVAPPDAWDDNLLNLFTLTDCHIGMLAWHKEGGADWDLSIAEATLVAAFGQMIARAPRAAVAIVNQLGDFLHFDGLDAVTPTNRHLLDADGRFRKITKVAIRVLRRVIDMALETHNQVYVVCAEGNHDLASSAWLALLIDHIYENEPRVTVDDSALPYYRYVFGKVFLGFSHGHVRKKETLPLLFIQQYRDEWGATAHSYIHTAHRHHYEEADKMGIRTVEHATLAARDAYAARHGYHAARQALVITYHREFGEYGRSVVTPDMLRGKIEEAA